MNYISLENHKIGSEPYYIPQNNLPEGISRYKDRIFVTVPRIKCGVPSTLNYFNLKSLRHNSSPQLRPYPNYETNEITLDHKRDPHRIVSVRRTRVDSHDRLWFIDTGINHGIYIQEPSLWIFNLKDDKLILRYQLPANIVSRKAQSEFLSITVDVDENDEENAFAYFPNPESKSIFVFDLKKKKHWVFKNNAHSGFSSIALGKVDTENNPNRLVYLSSPKEYVTLFKLKVIFY